MIDEMFFRFLSHWYDREQARAQYLQQMPEYAALLKKTGPGLLGPGRLPGQRGQGGVPGI